MILTSSLFITSLNSRLIRCAAMLAMIFLLPWGYLFFISTVSTMPSSSPLSKKSTSLCYNDELSCQESIFFLPLSHSLTLSHSSAKTYRLAILFILSLVQSLFGHNWSTTTCLLLRLPISCPESSMSRLHAERKKNNARV